MLDEHQQQNDADCVNDHGKSESFVLPGCDADGVVTGLKVVEEDVVKLVVIEEHVKLRKEIPFAAAYRIRVDKQFIDVPAATISGAEILTRAGKDPQKTTLYQHKPGQQPERVKPDHVVDLRSHGIERFTTMAKDSTEGSDSQEIHDLARDCESPNGPRREFLLPAEDAEYLTTRDIFWETINEKDVVRGKAKQWLIIHGWRLPEGYNHSAVNIALLIPPSYPDSKIDMVYVTPALARLDGHNIGALSNQKIEGMDWQRWSRHRTVVNPWRLGIDDISTHLSLVDDWFRREFGGA